MPATLAAAAATDTYRAGLASIRAELLAGLGYWWAQTVLQTDVAAGVDAWLPAAVALIARSQRLAAIAAPAYVAQFVSLSLDRAIEARPIDVEPLVGRVADGRPLGDVLPSVRPLVLTEIGAGTDPQAALQHGFQSAARIGGSETLRAGRDALDQAMVAEPHIRGKYRRVTSTDACPFCRAIAARGGVFRAQTTVHFAAHPHCSCSAEPVVHRTEDEYRRAYPTRDLPSESEAAAFWAQFNRRKAARADR